jgi:hypothetical protein
MAPIDVVRWADDDGATEPDRLDDGLVALALIGTGLLLALVVASAVYLLAGVA